MLTFNAEKHEYRDPKGHIVPSVTQVLSGAGLHDFSGVDAQVLKDAQDRGTAVHKMTELYDLGTLDNYETDKQLDGYLNAHKLAIKDFKVCDFMAIEMMVHNERLKYAGTLDRIAECKKFGRILFDIKTGAFHPAHGVQLAAYYNALPIKLQKEIQTIGTLYLSADGKYQFQAEENIGHKFSVFISALTVYRWKLTNNILNNNNENYYL